jgi:methylmalonyl-CoA/ethylmalonyl-CoA epimerase
VSAARRKGASAGLKRGSKAGGGRRSSRTPAGSEGTVRKAATSRRARGPVTAISHVAIATANADALADTLAAALGAVRGEEEMIDEGELRVLFVHLGPLTLELLEPRSVHHTVARFLGRRGPGLHHVSLDVAGIEDVLARCRAAGLPLIDETPREGAHGTRVAFLHPKGLGGVLVELCEAKARRS